MGGTPELLAPAGNPACAIAAFEAGADAVYAGLPRFNARERGENFTSETLASIVELAHSSGRRVYVTVNTLVKEQELPQVMETLSIASDSGADAVLIQDLGVLRMARAYFPKLELHASTQMAIHNSLGFETVKSMGVKRVVLERQVTLDELALIRERTDLEIECFIHGALCCSLSGVCYFSSILGGSSGNRGKCKQPCRRRYFSESGNGFFFSPQDLCAVEFLADLRRLPVQSLKIEGRLRQPDYVSAVTGAYRKLLDAPIDDMASAMSEAKMMLSRGYGRRWSRGFSDQESMRTLIRPDAVGASGLLCGKVEYVRENGFGFTSGCRIGLGDRIRIQPPTGDDGVSITITRLFVSDRPAVRGRRGDAVFVCCDKPVERGSGIFKIGESCEDYSGKVAALRRARTSVDMSVHIDGHVMEVSFPGVHLDSWSRELELAAATKHAVGPGEIESELSHSDSQELSLGKCQVDIDGNWFMPSSLLKELRRSIWRHVVDNLDVEAVSGLESARALNAFMKDYVAMKPSLDATSENVIVRRHGNRRQSAAGVLCDPIYELRPDTTEALLPEFCPEKELGRLELAVKSAYESGIRRFRITSLYAIALLSRYSGIRITASFPLPVANSLAAAELAGHGVSGVMSHIELERESVERMMEKSPVPVEIYRKGRPAILTTRATIPVIGEFRDRRGNVFACECDDRDGLTRIYPARVVVLPSVSGTGSFYDLRRTEQSEKDVSTFNFDGSWD